MADENGGNQPMIEAVGLGKFYGEFAAAREVTFSVPRGQVCAFLGPNGAGKSTTMKMLTGYLAPSEGDARAHVREPLLDLRGEAHRLVEHHREVVHRGTQVAREPLETGILFEEEVAGAILRVARVPPILTAHGGTGEAECHPDEDRDHPERQGAGMGTQSGLLLRSATPR